MTTLYLDRQGMRLQWRDGAIEIRGKDGLEQRVPAALVQRVVIRQDTVLHSNSLVAMAECGISLVAFGGRSGQRVAHMLGGSARDCRARIVQCQVLASAEWVDAWCRSIVRQRLRSQYLLLALAMEARADLRKPLVEGRRTLATALDRLVDLPNREVARGLEGSGAAAFFGAYAQLFPAAAQFHCRRRRPPPDPVNACLSLGYTLLHGRAVQRCWEAGLDPMVGFLHQPASGRPSLACDIMEPYRARIEKWIWHAWRDRLLRPDHFGHDGSGACLLGKAGRERFYASIHPVLGRCEHGLRRVAHRLARVLATGVRSEDLGSVFEPQEDPDL